jgi:hypothetical protein
MKCTTTCHKKLNGKPNTFKRKKQMTTPATLWFGSSGQIVIQTHDFAQSIDEITDVRTAASVAYLIESLVAGDNPATDWASNTPSDRVDTTDPLYRTNGNHVVQLHSDDTLYYISVQIAIAQAGHVADMVASALMTLSLMHEPMHQPVP